MEIKTRGFILAGHIITLVAALLMMIGSFILARLYDLNHLPEMATISRVLGFISLGAIPVSIAGMVHSRKPIGDFPNWATILNTLYAAALAVLEIIGGFQALGTVNEDLSVWFYGLALIAATTFLIIGLVKAYKEQAVSTKDYRSLLSGYPSNGQRGFVPPAVNPPVSNAMPIANTPSQSPEGNKIAEDLAALKNLFDGGLITEDEYKIKKQDILNRFFPK